MRHVAVFAMTAVIRFCANGDIDIRTPYHAGFVESLKTMIPWDCRRWNGDTKLWHVDSIFANQAIDIVRQYYDHVEVNQYHHQSSPPPPNFTTSTDPFRVLFLIPTAPGPVITAAYRALARMHHPDNGGETKTMQTINAAYDKLKDNAS